MDYSEPSFKKKRFKKNVQKMCISIVFFYCFQPPKAEGEEGGELGEDGEEAEAVIYKYIPPEPKEWVSQGSEKEIDEGQVVVTRGQVSKLHYSKEIVTRAHPLVSTFTEFCAYVLIGMVL